MQEHPYPCPLRAEAAALPAPCRLRRRRARCTTCAWTPAPASSSRTTRPTTPSRSTRGWCPGTASRCPPPPGVCRGAGAPGGGESRAGGEIPKPCLTQRYAGASSRPTVPLGSRHTLQDNLIDRYDVRSLLDMYVEPDTK